MTVSVLATVEEARSLLNDAVEKVILGDACHALVATPTRDWSGTSEARRAIRELFELADYLNQLYWLRPGGHRRLASGAVGCRGRGVCA